MAIPNEIHDLQTSNFKLFYYPQVMSKLVSRNYLQFKKGMHYKDAELIVLYSSNHSSYVSLLFLELNLILLNSVIRKISVSHKTLVTLAIQLFS